MSSLPPFADQVSASKYRYFDVDVLPNGPLRVACVGREHCNPHYVVDRDGFPCHGMEWVADGIGEVVLDGATHALSPGVVFAYGPSTHHRITCTQSSGMTKYFIDFFGDDAAAWLARCQLAPGSARQVFDVGPMRELFEQLVQLDQQDDGLVRELAAAYLRVILLRMGAGAQMPAPRSAASRSLYHLALQRIDSDFAVLRNLGDLARALNTQPACVCRAFQQHGQPGPFRVLTRRKLQRAAEMLAGSSVTVQEAAAAVGYDDPFHFSRLFRSCFGKSPTAFRQEFRRG